MNSSEIHIWLEETDHPLCRRVIINHKNLDYTIAFYLQLTRTRVSSPVGLFLKEVESGRDARIKAEKSIGYSDCLFSSLEWTESSKTLLVKVKHAAILFRGENVRKILEFLISTLENFSSLHYGLELVLF